VTDHLNALDYKFLTYYFKRDTDIDVFLTHWQNVEIYRGVKSLFDNDDEMTEEDWRRNCCIEKNNE